MRKLDLSWSRLNDESIAVIALCVDKIEELELNVDDVTIDGWKILSIAINNRSSPVS